MKMNHNEHGNLYLIAAGLLTVLCIPAAKAANITGVVRDEAGKAVVGVRLNLVNQQTSIVTAQTISSTDGIYRFKAIRPGTYQLIADLNNSHLSPATLVVVSAASSVVAADLLLKDKPQNEPANGPPPTFESVGVQGLIDSGGYSASASSAAASSLISGIANIKRTDNTVETPPGKDLPCTFESILKKDVEANPNNEDANRRLGEFYLAHGQANRAITILKRAQQLSSTDARVTQDLADALLMSRSFDAAKELANTLPSDVDADKYRLLARAEEGLGHFVQAAKDYRIAIKQSPTEQNLFGVGYELILAGMVADAEQAFSFGVERYPQSTILRIGLGTAEFLEGHSSTALQSFLKAAQMSPSNSGAYPFLVSVFEISGAEREQVIACVRRYLDAAPHDAEAYYLYARVLSRHSADGGDIDINQIEALLKQANALNPNLADAHFQLGRLYAERDDHNAAALEFETAIRLAPALREAHYRLAIEYRSLDETDKAAREMQLFREAGGSKNNEIEDPEVSLEKLAPMVSPQEQSSTQPGYCSTNLR